MYKIYLYQLLEKKKEKEMNKEIKFNFFVASATN